MSDDFFSKRELEIINEFSSKGYITFPIKELKYLEKIRSEVCRLICEFTKTKKKNELSEIINYLHKDVEVKDLNDLRIYIMDNLNNQQWFKLAHFYVAKEYLEILIGNELAMQRRINISIQFPDDDSSLLPVHSDIWTGHSPFELVLWIPLVDAFKTKSLFILPEKHYSEFEEQYKTLGKKSSEQVYSVIEKKVEFLNVPYGNAAIFSQHLPHGNRINKENETRLSFNCRFKGIFTPYAEKKFGEFYEPITLRPTSELGLNYKLPTIDDD